MLAQVPQVRLLRQVLFYKIASQPGEEHLAAMSSIHNTRGHVNLQSNVTLGSEYRLARMEADAPPHRYALRPEVTGEGALDEHCCRNGIGSTSKYSEERVSLRIHLRAVILGERLSQQPPEIGQHTCVALTKLL